MATAPVNPNITVNPTGQAIQPGQNLDAPTTPATVPTAAPTNATAINQPPASPTTPQTPVPTAVVSSATAANQVNNTIVPTMNNGQQDVANQSAANPKLAGTPGYDVYGNPVDTSGLQTARVNNGTYTGQDGNQYYKFDNSAVSGGTAQTPEQQIVSQPDAGNTFAYDSSGNQVQVPIGQALPTGYTATNPRVGPTTPVSNQASLPSGTTFKQFSDGTYGQYDANGNYVAPATADQYQTAQNSEGIMKSLQQAMNGAYPLTSDQQSQVSALQASYQTLITQQATANANLTGGTTVAENLYGMGTSLTGLGEIKGTVDAGIAKIGALQSEMSGAVSKMISGFQTDNITMLSDAYKMYSDAATSLQTNLDKLQTDQENAQKDFQTQVQNQFDDMIKSDTLTLQEKQDAITNAHNDAVLTETQAKDLADEATAREVAAKGTYQIKTNADGTESIFNTSTGQVEGSPTNDVSSGAVQAGQTGIPVLDDNTKTTASGISYIDGSNLTGAPATAAQLEAAKAGIPYIAKANADILTNIEQTRTNLSTLQTALQGLSSSNGVTRPFNTLGHKLESLTQMGPGATQINSYNEWTSTMISDIKAIAGPGSSGARGNQLVIQLMDEIPSVNDTSDTAAAKIQTMNNLLDSAEKGIFGEKVWNANNPDQANTYQGVTLPGGNTATTTGSTYQGITLPN